MLKLLRNKRKMSYDDTSFYGDRIVEEYDDKNNFIGTFTPSGFLVYHLLGDGFDLMSEMCSKFMNDFSILTADTKGLDNFWGVSYDMPRPRLPTSQRLLTDEEYKVYLYLRNCQLITKQDILIAFEKCFGVDDYPIEFSNEAFYLESTDHLHYEAEDSVSSNLHKRSDDSTLHFVTDFANDEATELIEGGLSEIEEIITVVNIPFNNWDNEFLSFLEQYISLKGNLKIREYNL